MFWTQPLGSETWWNWHEDIYWDEWNWKVIPEINPSVCGEESRDPRKNTHVVPGVLAEDNAARDLEQWKDGHAKKIKRPRIWNIMTLKEDTRLLPHPTQDRLKFTIFLPHLFLCWDLWDGPPCPRYPQPAAPVRKHLLLISSPFPTRPAPPSRSRGNLATLHVDAAPHFPKENWHSHVSGHVNHELWFSTHTLKSPHTRGNKKQQHVLY